MIDYKSIKQDYIQAIRNDIDIVIQMKEESGLTLNQVIEIAKITHLSEITLTLAEIKGDINSLVRRKGLA